MAEGLLGRGADVIILASGVNVGELVELLAEREQRAALISLDSYSHPEGEEIILASLGWDLALVVEETQAKLLEGFAAGVFNFGVEDGLLVVREGSQLSPRPGISWAPTGANLRQVPFLFPAEKKNCWIFKIALLPELGPRGGRGMVMGDFRQDSGEPMYTDIDIKTALALKISVL